jgi:hypothetical protein
MKLSLGLTPRDYSVAGGVVYDTDAQAYFTANTAITSAADKNAINDFYLGLKTDSIYSKIKQMGLYIWSSATANKWNMINPLDTDAAYRLNFSTGWTHASTGMTPNGTSAYADTFFIPSAVLTQNSQAFGYYSRTNRADSTAISFGARQTSPATITTTMQLRNSNNITSFVASSTSQNVANTDTRGFFQMSRTGASAGSIVKNNTVTSMTLTSTGINTYSMYLGARNNIGVSSNFDSCEVAFSYNASGLTSTELQNFYTRVNTLMTYFGINV